jgi:cytochrome P450
MNQTEKPFVAPALAGPVPPRTQLPFFRYVRAVSDNVIAGFHEDVYNEWIIRTRYLGPDHFILNDPAGIKRVLLDNSANYVKGGMEQRISGMGMSRGPSENMDESWRTRRKIMSPSFDYRSLPGFASIISNASERMLDGWDARQPGTPLGVPDAMLNISSEIISRILFSTEHKEIAAVMNRVSGQYRSETMVDFLDFVPVVNRARRSFRRRMDHRMFRHQAAAIDQVIERRTRESNPAEDGLLSRLMLMRDQETGVRISTEELRTNVTTLYTVGHETVAQTLTWIWYLLSQHPQQEMKLHRELDSVLAGRSPSHEDIDNLPYTRMVIEEALRLYPPFYTLAWREALADDELCGVAIPRGATISIVPWVLHRHRRLWEEPDRFDPERFLPTRSAGRPRMAYLPFGAGPRVCTGAAFAMTETTMILAAVAQRYRLRLAPGHKVEPQARLLLRPRYGLPMMLERRSAAE